MVGFPFTARVRLLGYAARYWEAFDGELAARGVDPWDLRFDRLLRAVYAFILRESRGGALGGVGLDEAIQRLEAELATPIPGMVKVDQEQVEDEMALFRRAAAG